MPSPPGIPNELFTYERKKRHWTQKDVADKIGAPVDERVIRRWERGDVAPTPHYRGKLAEVFGKSARALGFPPDGQISFWHMPYRRNAYFTGRDDILQLLRDTLLAQQSSPVPRLPLALSGLGGVGKSQIALEYAYRYREHYHTVLWLHAASYQDPVAYVTAVADLLDLPGKDTANPAQLIETLKEWLTQLTRWLLIFDNVEHLQLLAGFLPAEFKGHLLLTTRSQPTGTHAHRIAVEPMGSNTGAELLLRRAKLIALESTLAHMAAADAVTARSLSEDMGGLPLALDQAGAYIEETAVSLSEYEERYQEERRDLLHRRGSWVSDGEHPEPVAVTFRLSFEKACEHDPRAVNILNFCAFLQPDAIPEELFQHDDDSFKYGTTVFDEAIAALLRFSLIRRNTQEKTLSLHRLVQAVLIDGMPTDLQKEWRERVVLTLNAAFPGVREIENDYRARRQSGRLMSYVLACAAWSEDELTPTLEVAELFHKASWYLTYRTEYSKAKPLLARVLSIYEQHIGVGHTIAASELSSLASLYHEQGKDEQAEALYQQALTIGEKQLGTEHPDITWIMHHLALLYMNQDKNDQAEQLLKQVLSFREEHLGAEHPDTFTSLHSLAYLYFQQYNYEQAEALYRQGLAIREKNLGIEHHDTARSLFNLAVLYFRQGKDEQAVSLFLQVLKIWEQRLGAEHPDTIATVHVLAVLLSWLGKHEQSDAYYHILEKHYGTRMTSTLPEDAGELCEHLTWYMG